MYSKKVMDLFRNPHNMGRIENPDGVGKVGNLICGDVMHIYIKVKDSIIKDIKFETFGCAAAIATSSMITDLAKGKSIDKALKITRNDVSNALEKLPPIKEHCSNLAAEALHDAIYDYLSRNKMKIPEKLKKEHEATLRNLDTIEERHTH